MENSVKIKWKLDASTTIAIVALALSVLQFIFNTPIFVDFYLKPKISISGSATPLGSDQRLGSFTLTNSGEKSATNVEVGLTVGSGDVVKIMPNIKATIIEEEEAPLFKNVRIEIPKLNSGEVVLISTFQVDSDTSLRPDIRDFFKESGITSFPMVGFLRSDQGAGNVLINQVSMK
jgi:hypothetical protein